MVLNETSKACNDTLINAVVTSPLTAMKQHCCKDETDVMPIPPALAQHPKKYVYSLPEIYKKSWPTTHANNERGSWTCRAHSTCHLPATNPPDDDKVSHMAHELKRQNTNSEYNTKEDRKSHRTQVHAAARTCIDDHTMKD